MENCKQRNQLCVSGRRRSESGDKVIAGVLPIAGPAYYLLTSTTSPLRVANVSKLVRATKWWMEWRQQH